MSRIGKTPVKIDSNITVTLSDGLITIKGPKGELSESLHPLVKVVQDDGQLTIERKNDSKFARSLHGTYQRLVQNMVVGVTEGYVKNLDLVGVGYRVQKQGKGLSLALGYSHTIEYTAPEGVTLEIEGNNKIIVTGTNKQSVGQVASEIRAFRPPEPYKGKGIKYEDEVIRRKAGKAAKAA